MAERNRNSGAVDFGLLIMRLGVGAMFALFGWQKLQGGPEVWAKLGGAMAVFGITAQPVAWGFMAMFAELAGGLMLILGLFVRPYAALLLFTMITATAMLVSNGAPMKDYSHALDMAFVFAGLLVAGGGRYALGAQISALHGKWYA
jgi:putative oxidoreductase